MLCMCGAWKDGGEGRGWWSWSLLHDAYNDHSKMWVSAENTVQHMRQSWCSHSTSQHDVNCVRGKLRFL
jgi:hypothetical protein